MSSLRVGRRRSAILPTLVIVAILIVAFAVFTSVWTDRLWYGSFGYASVFSKMLLTRIGLFVAFGLIMATFVVANAAIAYRLRPRLGAQVPTSPLLERYRETLESRFVWILVALGTVVGLFAGGAASGRALDYLAWRNSTPFNISDPVFGLDVGFFVFAYPWWRFVLSFIFAALVFSAIVAAIVHYTMGGLRFSGQRRGGSRAAQAHLSILVGLAVLGWGAPAVARRHAQTVRNVLAAGEAELLSLRVEELTRSRAGAVDSHGAELRRIEPDLVVGATGVINTLAEVMLSQWKANELADMVKPYAGKPPPVHLASLDATLEKARKAAPDMNVSFVAFPGTPFTSSHHFAVFMRGDTPLTSRLLKPVLLDGETGEVSDARDLPVYLKALLVSQPLHFGDYGGMPLKIIWALLDVMTIVVIGSGLYLWLARRRSSIEVEIEELERAEARLAAE